MRGVSPADRRDSAAAPRPSRSGPVSCRYAGHERIGNRTRRTLGFASLGGATLDNEENYLIKKLFTALGAIQIENQARI